MNKYIRLQCEAMPCVYNDYEVCLYARWCAAGRSRAHEGRRPADMRWAREDKSGSCDDGRSICSHADTTTRDSSPCSSAVYN